MYKNFLKAISVASTITFILLGGTVASKAMWDELDPDIKNNITKTHCTPIRQFHDNKVVYESFTYDLNTIIFRLFTSGGRDAQFWGTEWENRNSLLAQQAKEVVRMVWHQPPWSQDGAMECPACQASIQGAYLTTVLPRKFLSLTEHNSQLQQRAAEFLTEVEELKDDIQRLKAELRAAYQQAQQPPL